MSNCIVGSIGKRLTSLGGASTNTSLGGKSGSSRQKEYPKSSSVWKKKCQKSESFTSRIIRLAGRNRHEIVTYCKLNQKKSRFTCSTNFNSVIPSWGDRLASGSSFSTWGSSNHLNSCSNTMSSKRSRQLSLWSCESSLLCRCINLRYRAGSSVILRCQSSRSKTNTSQRQGAGRQSWHKKCSTEPKL